MFRPSGITYASPGSMMQERGDSAKNTDPLCRIRFVAAFCCGCRRKHLACVQRSFAAIASRLYRYPWRLDRDRADVEGERCAVPACPCSHSRSIEPRRHARTSMSERMSAGCARRQARFANQLGVGAGDVEHPAAEHEPSLDGARLEHRQAERRIGLARTSVRCAAAARMSRSSARTRHSLDPCSLLDDAYHTRFWVIPPAAASATMPA